jgi:hypothetical protein
MTLALTMLVDTGVHAFAFGACGGHVLPMGRSFDQDRFIEGHWFEVYRDRDVWFQAGQDCVSQTFENGQITKVAYDIENEEWSSSKISIRFDINGHGYNQPWDWFPIETAFHVIDTDYIQYALVYGCDDWFWGFFHTEQSWLMSRTEDTNRVILKKARDTFEYEAPWYSIADEWVKIKQGEAEGCKYELQSEMKTEDEKFEEWLNENERQE